MENDSSKSREGVPKVFGLKEVSKHSSSDSSWIVIQDNVYDVTKFLNKHPGGEDVLLEQAGMDATESFHIVGHSMDAQEMMEEYWIGELSEEDKKSKKDAESTKACATSSNLPDQHTSWQTWVVVVGMVCMTFIFCWYKYRPM
ncbi:hypothetical protein Pcinc_016525 [Petrolisthes cinctipes]|uniref:Cytochrome b5 n=1 Tax=Petrolisthes cinctipes TaxID=88211 RepID=A0AAE1FR70_PETCI|nr:hypothetical protein Pcinc_016525 [Petrolisthes cinctipes]